MYSSTVAILLREIRHGMSSQASKEFGALGGRSENATLNRPLLRGRGAVADTLNGSARQFQLGHGVRNHVNVRNFLRDQKTTGTFPQKDNRIRIEPLAPATYAVDSPFLRPYCRGF